MERTRRLPFLFQRRELLLLLLLPLFMILILPDDGEAVAVLAIETYEGYSCRWLDESSFLTKEDISTNTTTAPVTPSTPAGHRKSSVGMCVLAKPETKQTLNAAHIFSFKSADVNLTAGIDSLALWISVNGEKKELNETLREEAWNKVCIGVTRTNLSKTSTSKALPPPEKEVDPDSGIYRVWGSLRGRSLNLNSAGSMSGGKEFSLNVKVCFGAEEKNNASFIGMITGVTLLTGEEVEENEDEGKENEEEEEMMKNRAEMRFNSNCSASVVRNILTHPLNESWDTVGPVLTLEKELPEDPCLVSLISVRLQGPQNYQEFLSLCRSLGGYFPKEEEAAKGLLEEYNRSKGENLTWASGWKGVEDGPAALCPTLLAGGGTGQEACFRKLDYALCMVPEGLSYTLFGPRNDFDRHYTLRTLEDGTFDFQGEETSSIYQEGTGWTLSSTLHSDKLHQDSWVMGRHRWCPASLNCSTNTPRDMATVQSMDTNTDLLTFTVCNAIQFSSDDGVCLLRSERCDGNTDSPDKSDEEHCGSRRTISKDSYYDTHVNPFFGNKEKGTIFYEINMMFINKMSTEEGKANVEFNLYLDWEDTRINFVDSKMNNNYFSCEDIWTPSFLFYGGYTIGPAVQPLYNRTTCYIHWITKPREEQQLGDPLMGRILTKTNITQYRNLVFDFPCLLRVSRYPFGRYMCNLTFSFFRDRHDVKWRSTLPMEEDDLVLAYDGNKDLLDFRLDKVTVNTHHSEMLTLTLHLVGQPDYHLTNSFLPSSLMFLICYSSLIFPIAGFNERIMVSLTSLLVLVALFSQATDTYVRTPYYKLIDVWYVCLILLCFAVVISNVIVNYLRIMKVKSHTNLMSKVLAAKKCNIICQVFLLSNFVLLIFMFFLFSTDSL